ncbi:MAG TPA: PEP/pyruvate-binding domain-containing protein [Ktedonobacteraceae bacterium]|nr:PEP/pyruvate-binding domain-containing protein [Ktedonobacteraceae bacterium]
MRIEQNIPLILALNDANATLEQVGGKGASLACMAAAGLPVPPGFHITTAAYRRFVMEHGLQEEILAAVSAVTADHPATIEEASRRIAELFARSVMPDEIARVIRQAYAELGGDDLPVAVRSSATAEDLPEMSFAGQQETYLNMHGEAMVLEAVKRCWASLWTARAIGYRARYNIAPEDVSLAVVVQKLLPADASGILFTANPLTGARDQVMINAAWGLGEAIVGGLITPDTIVVDRASGAITEQKISEKDVMTVRTIEGTVEEPVPADLRARAVLSPVQAAELARFGVQIEDLYGQPMDIEWALHDGSISVLQARPITALPKPAARPQVTQAAEWKLPNPKGRYMRSSVLELLPDPLSPLFATLGLPAWTRATMAFLRSIRITDIFAGEMLTTINGYGYYDLTFTPAQAAKLVLAMPRLIAIVGSPLLRTSQTRWQESRSRYAEVVSRWQATDLATASADYLLTGARDIITEAAQYYLSVQSGILPAAYMSESLFTLVYNRFLKRRNAPSALTFVLGFDSTPILAEKSLYDLAQWVREQPELAAALANMSSEQFATAYREQAAQMTAADGVWPEFWRRLADHLARFGHTIYDLDFAKAVLADDPVPVLETLKFFLSGQAPDPYERQATAKAAREQATQTILNQRRGLRLKLFRRLVGSAQRFAPLREDALADVGLGWPVLRRMLREIGRRTAEASAINTPDDIFWLTQDEVQTSTTALDTRQPLADYHAVVAERRATWERERTVAPPAALPLKGGARFLGIDWSRMMPARTDQPAGDVIKGVAASPGRVTGPARVIHGPNEFNQMRPGDILVARITTPAWTPLFALAAGVVTDVGGPLSHSSIVAREYHIPAVLGTGVATERLSSGQRITVDGDAGTVTIIGEA